MSGGRPLKLNEPHPNHPTRAAAIEHALLSGAYIETAAAYAGIGTTTLYRYLAEGREADAIIAEHGKTAGTKRLSKRQAQLWEFWDTLTRARALVETRNLSLIQQAAVDDWKAAAWFVERAYPSRWGRWERDSTDPEQSGGTIEQARARLAALPDTPLASVTDDDA